MNNAGDTIIDPYSNNLLRKQFETSRTDLIADQLFYRFHGKHDVITQPFTSMEPFHFSEAVAHRASVSDLPTEKSEQRRKYHIRYK